jgi:arsenate reductase
MSSVRILHNPRCSKSRQTLALLEEKGIAPDIILYLKTPLSADELSNIAQLLNTDIRQMMRSGEAEFKQLGLADESLSDAQLLAAMATCPKLVQRPIVINGDKAAIGRPPENVLDIL